MRAVIMETSDGYAAALKEDGTFIKIKDKNYHKGDVIDMNEFKFFSKRTMKIWIAVPATCLILFVGIIGYSFITPYYYVSLDVNPGITFEVNRFQRIIDIEAANDDAEDIVNAIDQKNLTIQEGLNYTVALISDAGYFDEGNGEIYISTAGKDRLKASELSMAIKNGIVEYNQELNIFAQVNASIFDLVSVKEAKNKGLTPGKYDLLINDLGLTLTDENIHKSIGDLFKQSTDNKSSDDDYTNIMNAVKGYILNDKDLFLNAVAGLGEPLPGIDKLSYGDAKQFFAKAIEAHMGISIKSSKLSLEEILARVDAELIKGQKEEAAYYGVDIEGLSFAEAQIKIEATKMEYMRKEQEELKTKAAQYNIDITGMDKEEAWRLIKEAEMAEQSANGPNLNNPEELKAQAEKFNVNIAGLSTEEAIEAVKRAMDSQNKGNDTGSRVPDVTGCKNFAEKMGIDLSGLTNDQILSKIKPIMLETMSKDFGVNVAGLSEEAAFQTIYEAQWQKLISELAAYGVDATNMNMSEAYDILHKKNEESYVASQWSELKRRAEFVGADIDFTGLSLEAAEQKVMEAEAFYNERKPLLEQAAQWGFDPSGMTNAEIDAKITELLKTPHDFPTDENGN